MKKSIIISSEFFGKGDDILGAKLMGSFLRKLTIEENKPEKIIFMNSGVKLLAENSAVFDAVEILENAGVILMACGTCARHYNITDKISPEMICDMIGVISSLMKSDDVITI